MTADRIYPLPPWWQDRWDDLDDRDLDFEDPEPAARTSWYDDLDQPRIDCYWDEREEAANGH